MRSNKIFRLDIWEKRLMIHSRNKLHNVSHVGPCTRSHETYKSRLWSPRDAIVYQFCVYWRITHRKWKCTRVSARKLILRENIFILFRLVLSECQAIVCFSMNANWQERLKPVIHFSVLSGAAIFYSQKFAVQRKEFKGIFEVTSVLYASDRIIHIYMLVRINRCRVNGINIFSRAQLFNQVGP